MTDRNVYGLSEKSCFWKDAGDAHAGAQVDDGRVTGVLTAGGETGSAPAGRDRGGARPARTAETGVTA